MVLAHAGNNVARANHCTPFEIFPAPAHGRAEVIDNFRHRHCTVDSFGVTEITDNKFDGVGGWRWELGVGRLETGGQASGQRSEVRGQLRSGNAAHEDADTVMLLKKLFQQMLTNESAGASH